MRLDKSFHFIVILILQFTFLQGKLWFYYQGRSGCLEGGGKEGAFPVWTWQMVLCRISWGAPLHCYYKVEVSTDILLEMCSLGPGKSPQKTRADKNVCYEIARYPDLTPTSIFTQWLREHGSTPRAIHRIFSSGGSNTVPLCWNKYPNVNAFKAILVRYSTSCLWLPHTESYILIHRI
jgi:hypothetical protein